jgi:hypothetical protein
MALDNGTWTYNLDGKNITITGYFGTCSSELIIPNIKNGNRLFYILVNAMAMKMRS